MLKFNHIIIIKKPGIAEKDKIQDEIIPAQVRVKLWLGLEKEEKDWVLMHSNEDKNGAISIYAETVYLIC